MLFFYMQLLFRLVDHKNDVDLAAIRDQIEFNVSLLFNKREL